VGHHWSECGDLVGSQRTMAECGKFMTDTFGFGGLLPA
jgi:hypothetical protein